MTTQVVDSEIRYAPVFAEQDGDGKAFFRHGALSLDRRIAHRRGLEMRQGRDDFFIAVVYQSLESDQANLVLVLDPYYGLVDPSRRWSVEQVVALGEVLQAPALRPGDNPLQGAIADRAMYRGRGYSERMAER